MSGGQFPRRLHAEVAARDPQALGDSRHTAEDDHRHARPGVGVPPVAEGTPAEIAAKITTVAHDTFMSGMSPAPPVAAGVAAIAVLVAFLTKRVENAEAGAGAAHIQQLRRCFARGFPPAFAYQGEEAKDRSYRLCAPGHSGATGLVPTRLVLSA